MFDLLTLGSINYLMATVALLAFGLLAFVVMAFVNNATRRFARKSAFWLLAATVVVFLAVEVFILQVPEQAYKQGYAAAIGRPDHQCPVFETDDDGNVILNEDGNQDKHAYKLVGRPVVLAMDGEIHLWLSNRSVFPDGTHLCALPLTSQNGQFADKATEAWDNLHGAPGSGQGEQELNGAQGEGEQGQPGQGQSQGQVPDIIIELPSQGENSEGDSGEARQPPNGGYDQSSEGSVTIQPPDGGPDKNQ